MKHVMEYIAYLIFLDRLYHQVYIMGYIKTTTMGPVRHGIDKKDTIKTVIEEIEIFQVALETMTNENGRELRIDQINRQIKNQTVSL